MLADVDAHKAQQIAYTAVTIARLHAPKLTGASSSRLEPVYGDGYFGVFFPDCVAVGTRVLKADWTWVPVESLKVGDALIGFDESGDPSANGRGRSRRYRTSHVTATGVDPRECVRVSFDDGTSVVCTSNHPWLVKKRKVGKPRVWVEAADLKPGHLLGVYFDVWETDQTREGGWLAGMYDGEGSHVYNQRGRYDADTNSGSLNITQNEGPVLDHIVRLLIERGYKIGIRGKGRPGACRNVEILGGFAEQVRLLGSIRPIRLLPKIRYEGRSMNAIRNRAVVKVEPVGKRDVVVMSTSEQTYIAEGMGSHNTYVWFQDHGISPFTMRSLAGKVIPMWINDPTGAERSKNPKAKTRTTASGVVQVLIFRKAARLGSQITKRKRDPKTGRMVETSKPASYPGAPGRINRREMGAPHTTPGRLGGAIAPGNGGVRWRHPGIAPRLFLNHGVTMAAQRHGILPVRVYVCDSTTNLQRYQ